MFLIFRFFLFCLLTLAKQFMPSNPYFRNPGHLWYGFTSLKQSLHQFISLFTCRHIPSDCKMIWHLSSVPLSGTPQGAASPQHGFFPTSFFWLGDLAFVSSCITKSYSGCSFCVGDLGFNGLVSGVVLTALIRRWPGDGASLTDWLKPKVETGASFECRKSMLKSEGFGVSIQFVQLNLT